MEICKIEIPTQGIPDVMFHRDALGMVGMYSDGTLVFRATIDTWNGIMQEISALAPDNKMKP